MDPAMDKKNNNMVGDSSDHIGSHRVGNERLVIFNQSGYFQNFDIILKQLSPNIVPISTSES